MSFNSLDSTAPDQSPKQVFRVTNYSVRIHPSMILLQGRWGASWPFLQLKFKGRKGPTRSSSARQVSNLSHPSVTRPISHNQLAIFEPTGLSRYPWTKSSADLNFKISRNATKNEIMERFSPYSSHTNPQSKRLSLLSTKVVDSKSHYHKKQLSQHRKYYKFLNFSGGIFWYNDSESDEERFWHPAYKSIIPKEDWSWTDCKILRHPEEIKYQSFKTVRFMRT